MLGLLIPGHRTRREGKAGTCKLEMMQKPWGNDFLLNIKNKLNVFFLQEGRTRTRSKETKLQQCKEFSS